VWVETNILIPPTKIEAAVGRESKYSINILLELDANAVLIINGFKNDEINEGEMYRALRYVYQKYGRHRTTIVHLSAYGFLPFWTSLYSTALLKSPTNRPDEAEPFQRSYPKQIKLLSMRKDIIPMMLKMTELFPELPISDLLKNCCHQTQAILKSESCLSEEKPLEKSLVYEFSTILSQALEDEFKLNFPTEQKSLHFGWKNHLQPICTDHAQSRSMIGTEVIGQDFCFFVGVLESEKLILVWKEKTLSQAGMHLGYRHNKNLTYQTVPLEKLLRSFHLPLRETWKEELEALAISWIQSTVIPAFEAYRNYEAIDPDTVITKEELWKNIWVKERKSNN
jgi:hypothetical protein